ncbi:hypothetical protein FRC00_008739 [Tulasnella sp. 408]|nr:hypothetical protein FRC00_008739 [Tulasnella sp. 408]
MLTCTKANCRCQDLVRQAEVELALVDLELIDDAEDAVFLHPDLTVGDPEPILSVEMWLPPEPEPDNPAGSSTLKRKLETRGMAHVNNVETAAVAPAAKPRIPLLSLRGEHYRKAEALALSLDPTHLPHSSQVYIGSPNSTQPMPSLDPNSVFQGPLPSVVDKDCHSRVHNLVRSGYRLLSSTEGPTLFLNKESRIIGWRMGMVGGAGNEERWTQQNADLTRALESLATHMDGRKRESPGVSRGEHSWAHWGYSYGGGERRPSSRQQTKQERDWWGEFLCHPAYLATTKSLEESWVTWAPNVHSNYLQCHLSILQCHPSLDQVHLGSPNEVIPFASLTVNLGPQTVCKPHRDIKNKASGGICTIKMLGPYNWRLGGHIVLHELGLVVEMRPGDVIFFPSAVITHETIPISPDKKRYSLVWYSAGGLFRWCDANFRSLRSWEKQDPQSYKAHQAEGETRWTEGWENFSTLADLISQT